MQIDQGMLWTVCLICTCGACQLVEHNLCRGTFLRAVILQEFATNGSKVGPSQPGWFNALLEGQRFPCLFCKNDHCRMLKLDSAAELLIFQCLVAWNEAQVLIVVQVACSICPNAHPIRIFQQLFTPFSLLTGNCNRNYCPWKHVEARIASSFRQHFFSSDVGNNLVKGCDASQTPRM